MRFLSSLAPLTLLASCVASAGIVPRDTTKMSRGLMAGFLDIDPVPASEFDPFFDNDHFPRLFKVPGFLSNSRFDAIDGQQPEQVTLFDLESIQTVRSPEWVYFDTHRPSYEIDIITRVNTSDLHYYEMDSAPVGGVKGPSVLAFIQYTPVKGKEQYIKGGIELGLVPYLQTVKGFQRARSYKLDSYLYVHHAERPAPPTNVLTLEFKRDSGVFDTKAFKELKKDLLKNKDLSAVSIRLYKTRNTFGNYPWA